MHRRPRWHAWNCWVGASESVRGSHSGCVPGRTLPHGPAVLVHMVRLQWRATVFAGHIGSHGQVADSHRELLAHRRDCPRWGAWLGRWARLGGPNTGRREAREQWSKARALGPLVVPLSPRPPLFESPGPSASAYIPERDCRLPSVQSFPCLRFLLASTRSSTPHPSHPCLREPHYAKGASMMIPWLDSFLNVMRHGEAAGRSQAAHRSVLRR